MIISHIDNSGKIQTNEKHQKDVAELASRFASDFGCGDVARIMGLLHDKGKEQTEWQKYIKSVSCNDNQDGALKRGPHHAYVGACIANKMYPKLASLIGQPIAGHHRGLYDFCDYCEEIKRKIPNDVSLDECLAYEFPQFPKLERYDLHHVIRMLFSCLVDADSLDTESFMNPEHAKLRGSHDTMKRLLLKMEQHLQTLRSESVKTEVNLIRNLVQEYCVKESNGSTGFYSLTVPTGGGKTLASVLWALHHAVKNSLHRIIIAIPYTSIIVQTAATLKAIFGEDNVLEHHSNVNPEDVEEGERRERLQLATENWDYPIVVTTNVQLFESLFSNKRSDCRKLHNIVRSVVILDEVQTLPLGFYKPIVHTIDTLKRVFGTSFLFTTASQPILSGRIEGTSPMVGFDALKCVHEIIPIGEELHERLRRVKLIFQNDAKSYDALAKELVKHKRVLCIVNTRKDAKEIYELLPKEGICLHLSRMMCPAHVAATIQYMKDTLKKNETEPIRIVATQLIEAGVDIDFPVVYRQVAGLDSILQAAGRCNREGKHNLGLTYVFSLDKENSLPPGLITQANNARLAMGSNHDWFSPKAMNCYFQQLHSRTGNYDIKQMQELLYKSNCEFEEASKHFHLIDDNTKSVIVNWKDSMSLYCRLKTEGPHYSLMKKLSQYSINVRMRDFQRLVSMGVIEEPYEDIFIISDANFYKSDTGLSMENHWLEETYIV